MPKVSGRWEGKGRKHTGAVLGNARKGAGYHVLRQREVGRERFITVTMSVITVMSMVLSGDRR